MDLIYSFIFLYFYLDTTNFINGIAYIENVTLSAAAGQDTFFSFYITKYSVPALVFPVHVESCVAGFYYDGTTCSLCPPSMSGIKRVLFCSYSLCTGTYGYDGIHCIQCPDHAVSLLSIFFFLII